MTTEFTPFLSLFGGLLIGSSTVLLMLTLGRIMGATGVLAGFLQPTSASDWSWRAALLAGMVTAPILMTVVTGQPPTIQVPVSTLMMIVGGFIVGVGVTYGAGCTSGHGVCGMARFSPRSIAATVTFMIFTAITVYVVRHVFGV
ncbi:YeeE/YedE family protein [Salibaculum sp.]|uniref:YeeE/YedE family protein n=1 Tax=Salibaculum sp. TaxID=2855480 RepID=UPI002B45943B|nr:YeeE/YedE thiosulfate transporter family protein [Salibaculum sp.]HKL70600.1 YeeE/YedE thiosulfate transporter family protein [Salibaculum sp.]